MSSMDDDDDDELATTHVKEAVLFFFSAFRFHFANPLKASRDIPNVSSKSSALRYCSFIVGSKSSGRLLFERMSASSSSSNSRVGGHAAFFGDDFAPFFFFFFVFSISGKTAPRYTDKRQRGGNDEGRKKLEEGRYS